MAKNDELINLKEAAALAGLTTGHLRNMIRWGQIEGAVLRENEGARGRWYVPRQWAEERGRRGTVPEQVIALAEAEPELTGAEIAEQVGCHKQTAWRVLREWRAGQQQGGPASATERQEEALEEPQETPSELAKVTLWRSSSRPAMLVAMHENGRAWIVPDRPHGWSARTDLRELPRGAKRLNTRDEEQARQRLAGD